MDSTDTSRSRVIRRRPVSIAFVFCCMILSVGCGEPAVHESNLSQEFAAKLEQEHPELFIRKIGKNKTEQVGGRDKRAIIRREWQKAQQQGTQ